MHRCQHSFKKFLQIYELFAEDPKVSKEFPTLVSPRLNLVILSNLLPHPPKIDISDERSSLFCEPANHNKKVLEIGAAGNKLCDSLGASPLAPMTILLTTSTLKIMFVEILNHVVIAVSNSYSSCGSNSCS